MDLPLGAYHALNSGHNAYMAPVRRTAPIRPQPRQHCMHRCCRHLPVQQPLAGTRVPAGDAVTIWVEPDGGGGGNVPRVEPDKPLDGAGAA